MKLSEWIEVHTVCDQRTSSGRPASTRASAHLHDIDWTGLQDAKDRAVWTLLTSSLWVPADVPLRDDLGSWHTLTHRERQLMTRVFAGLTLLETVPGALSLTADATDPHEEAVYNAIAFMEVVHADSYSAVLSTLCEPAEVDDAVRWSVRNENAKRTSAIVLRYYRGDEPLMRKVVHVMLESFVLHAGFYLPLYLGAQGKLPNTANLIRMVIRDETVHGEYIGHKFRRGLAQASPQEQAAVRDRTVELLAELYANQVRYAHELYGPALCAEAEKYLLHHADRALQHLGYEPMSGSGVIAIDPAILAPPGDCDANDRSTA